MNRSRSRTPSTREDSDRRAPTAWSCSLQQPGIRECEVTFRLVGAENKGRVARCCRQICQRHRSGAGGGRRLERGGCRGQQGVEECPGGGSKAAGPTRMREADGGQRGGVERWEFLCMVEGCAEHSTKRQGGSCGVGKGTKKPWQEGRVRWRWRPCWRMAVPFHGEKGGSDVVGWQHMVEGGDWSMKMVSMGLGGVQMDGCSECACTATTLETCVIVEPTKVLRHNQGFDPIR
jgi:hypothetical protein